uniref:Uncharacterized protein n=1 Tax=Anguilla anguilla TaxID=7936 RepID=A0A0E9V9W6_ANGAN
MEILTFFKKEFWLNGQNLTAVQSIGSCIVTIPTAV